MIRAQPMGNFRRIARIREPGNSHGHVKGALTGTRISIRPESGNARRGLTGCLTHTYGRHGAYYALIDGQNLETVVRPHEWDLL